MKFRIQLSAEGRTSAKEHNKKQISPGDGSREEY